MEFIASTDLSDNDYSVKSLNLACTIKTNIKIEHIVCTSTTMFVPVVNILFYCAFMIAVCVRVICVCVHLYSCSEFPDTVPDAVHVPACPK